MQWKTKAFVNEYKIAEQERQLALAKIQEAKEQAQIYSQQNRAQGKYKYFIGVQGNSSQVIRRCLQLREDRWEETREGDKLFSFKWQAWSRRLGNFSAINTFGQRQLVNHVPGHEQLTTKDLLFENVALLCELRKIDVFTVLPVTFTLKLENRDSTVQEFTKFMNIFNSLVTAGLEDTNLKHAATTLPSAL